MPKHKRIYVVSDKCKRCALFGQCKGKVLPPDEFCLGYRDKIYIPKAENPPNVKAEFISSANNGSICDECINEFDGMCRLTWNVALYKVNECTDFKHRILQKEAV